MIKIGKIIYNILKNDSNVNGYVDGKIYPLVIPTNTELPSIVYERRGSAESTIDNYTSYQSTIDITIMDDNYTSTINIAEAINNALNNYSGVVDNIRVKDIQLLNYDEAYGEDAYIQKIDLYGVFMIIFFKYLVFILKYK